MMFQPGQDIAHFRIVRKLGQGGMGEVYLAEDQKLNRNVALKILQEEFVDDADRMSRFSREAKTAAKISHPNVMAIYDMDSAHHKESGRDVTYIVMEHISGQSLTDHLATRSPDMTELLRIAENIAAGLAAAHKLGIVHRDIKSDNIMIDEQGEPRILDFGLAKPIDTGLFGGDGGTNTMSGELTQEGKILGTVSYMSPEQARGEPVDARSDGFSFGILLYKMFAGQSPFEGPDRVSILAKILEGRHVPLRQRNETAPAELERIVDKCLHKDPNDRYQDTRDLVVDLRSLRRQYDSGISETSSISSEMLLATKKRRTFRLSGPKLIGALAVLLILTATVAFFGRADEKTTTEDPLAFVENLGEQITRTLAEQGIDVDGGQFEIPGFSKVVNGLAILGFQNKTGDIALDWLSAGLPEILLTDLAQSGAVNLISRGRMLDCLDAMVDSVAGTFTHGEWVTAARKLGATTVLAGAYYKLGDKIRIDARLEDVESGQIILAEKVVGVDPFVLVDSLTQKIAQSLNVKGMMAENRQVSDITSSSPEAFKEYILGMEKFGLSQYDSANVHFEEAIRLDSTFALPYMRIGMGYALRGRTQQAIQYLAQAQQFEDRLPVQDRSLLDIHKDLWFKRQYDDGVIKLRAYVANYPTDKEARSFYALLLHNLKKDKVAALAQLDTVMALDSRYLMALTWYVTIHTQEEELDKAIEYSLLMKQYYPQLPDPYRNLMTLYHQQARLDDAVVAAHDLLSRFPEESAALSMLTSAFILQRRFDSAAYYVEQRRKRSGNDPYKMITYHMRRSNLDFWSGRFKAGMDELFQSRDLAIELGDSGQIHAAYSRIMNRYEYLGMTDSASYYNTKANHYADQFQRIDFYLLSASFDNSIVPSMRSEFEEGVRNFQSRLPEEMWGLADEVLNLFNAFGNADTTALINSYRAVMENYAQDNTENRETIGRLSVLSGKYEEGKTFLRQICEGDDETTQARHYMRGLYYLGIAEEALGNTDAATEAYRELTRRWGDSDIKLDIITDARARLARLTS